MTRRAVTALLLLGLQVYLYGEYAALGAQFHYWLHLLAGTTAGLAVLTTWRLVRPWTARRVAAHEAAGLGHLVSGVPDVLFLLLGVLHAWWMDVFVLHVRLHFVPEPLLVGLLAWWVALGAYGLALLGRRRAPALLLAGLVVGVGGAVAAADLPGSTVDTAACGAAPPAASGPWLCPAMADLCGRAGCGDGCA